MSDSQAQVKSSDPNWAPIQVAIKDPRIQPLVNSYAGFHWLLRKHCRRLVEADALTKTGKSWAVSLTRAPMAIEAIYKEQKLAALDR